VTVRQISKRANDARETPAMRHREVSERLAQKGDVVVIDAGGRTDVATWGEFHCYRALRNDVAGAVIFGSARDAPYIRTSGFPVFCKGVSPVKSRWDLKTAAINEPVLVGGIEVCPGDIVFADETGVIIVPLALKEKVLARALEIAREEDSQREKMRARHSA
jgi:regulator of RNase E activity RraA